MSLPRVLFAGVQSGSGKTTVSCAVMQALIDRGLSCMLSSADQIT